MISKHLIAKLFIVTAIVMVLSTSAFAMTKSQWVVQQEGAHEIAESARTMGLPENDPIIVRAQELWNTAQKQIEYDRDLISTAIYWESGHGCTDEHMSYVGAAIVNRTNSSKFPDTVYGVITAPGQYLKSYAVEGSYYWKGARADTDAWAKCQSAAMSAMKGEVDCPDNVVYQANFAQGSGIYKRFRACGNWTYFCYQ